MHRNLPSTIALSCFESAAKHESFTKAAEELCLTQSAVSRQIKNLEDLLGCLLFERVKKRLHLTDAGKEYQQHVVEILKQLDVATTNLQKKIKGRIRVGIDDSLTTHWLIPKLNDFRNLYPEIETEFVNDLHMLYELTEGFDVGILIGEGYWTNHIAKPLMTEQLVAVCTSDLLEKYGEVKNSRDVLNYPFLHHTTNHSTTKAWLNAVGLSKEEISAIPGPRFEHFRLLVEAAKAGLGITIIPHYFVEKELAQGLLVLACNKPMANVENYYIVTPENRANDPKIKAFSDWLLSWTVLDDLI